MKHTILETQIGNADVARDALDGKKILVVDDSKTYRKAAVSILAGLGYKDVLVAEDGAEGLKLLQKHKRDIGLVVSDIDMPNMNGIELLTEIRYNRKGNLEGPKPKHSTEVPVVLATAESSDNRLHTAHQLDAAYVPKPYDKDALVRGMAEAIVLATDLRHRNEALLGSAAKRPSSPPLTFRKGFGASAPEA